MPGVRLFTALTGQLANGRICFNERRSIVDVHKLDPSRQRGWVKTVREPYL